MSKDKITPSIIRRLAQAEWLWGKLTEGQRLNATKNKLGVEWRGCDARDKAKIIRALGI